ncbi:CinA family protein [Butyrivibrio sp. AE3004]|uniref:CinA family protein n=1 Tax=Butyrivibrio sp. AE3004 TaxID=1506994 RepID=UPI000494D7B2|nr:CinA family protein [Butyrivibrio sp. AE3004]
MNNEEKTIKKYESITKLLIKKKLTITTMESCTAGMIANLLTDTEGSSAILKGAFITYSNEAKILQGVPSDIIEKHGVYSIETASHMALSCKKTYTADIGIGVTGTMGNIDPANSDSIPGEIYAAIVTDNNIEPLSFKITEPMPTRHDYKIFVADKIADAILQIIDTIL